MAKGILERCSREYMVLDGAMGTLLLHKGLSGDELPEEWNIRRPEAVRDIHLGYLMAGAQIIETNNAVLRFRLEFNGKLSKLEELAHTESDRDSVGVATTRFPVDRYVRRHPDLPVFGQEMPDEILDVRHTDVLATAPSNRPPVLGKKTKNPFLS